MKRTFTLTIASMLIAIGAIAKPNHPPHGDHYYANGSTLSLKLLPRGTYTVVMNGVRYYDVRDIFEISGLTAGSHRIRVIEYFNHGHGHGHGHGKGHGNQRNVIYDGYINIPYRSDVMARLTPNNRIMVQHVNRRPAPAQPRYNPHQQRHDHGSNRGQGTRSGTYRRY